MNDLIASSFLKLINISDHFFIVNVLKKSETFSQFFFYLSLSLSLSLGPGGAVVGVIIMVTYLELSLLDRSLVTE